MDPYKRPRFDMMYGQHPYYFHSMLMIDPATGLPVHYPPVPGYPMMPMMPPDRMKRPPNPVKGVNEKLELKLLSSKELMATMPLAFFKVVFQRI